MIDNLMKYLYEFYNINNKFFYANNEYILQNHSEDQTGISVNIFNPNADKEKEYTAAFIKDDWLKEVLNNIVERKVLGNELRHEGLPGLFICELLSKLPFINKSSNNSLGLRTFSTSDLPGHFNNSMRFLSEQSLDFRKLILGSPFFNLIYNLLNSMSAFSLQQKREILLNVMYITVKSSTGGTPITESVAIRRLGDTLTWLQEFRMIDENLEHLRDLKNTKEINYWWVNQGQSAKEQTEGGFLWSPKTDKKGTPLSHHNDVMKAEPGDIVIAYSDVAIRSICVVEKSSQDKPKPSTFAGHNNWGEQGNLLKVNFYALESPINKIEIPEQWRTEEDGPFDRNGNVKQGYFYEITKVFGKKLLSKFRDRIPEEILRHIQLPENNSEIYGGSQSMVFSSDHELIEHIYTFITSKGFLYSKDQITNFYLSLKTKPFVILSGISGTGKTKIVQLFAESLGATEENGQFTLIPVRPDWSDGSDLIGYENIKGEFQPGPFTKVLAEANRLENRHKPYFVLLDEMNLARVEYYFSDLLSVMESRKIINGDFLSTPVVNREETGTLYLRDNIYIIGTVNMDETTHPFSPKVLDRANTIEYNDVYINNFGFLSTIAEPKSVSISNEQISGKYLTIKDAFYEQEELILDITDWLMEINAILEPTKSHFGYRVRDEVCFYMIYNEKEELMDRNNAFDHQLHQKILPRLTGNDLKTEHALKELFRFCTNHKWAEQDIKQILEEARFKKSAEKLSNMIVKIQHDGFTSFWGQ